MDVPSEDKTHEDSLWSRLLPRLSTSTRLSEMIRGDEPSVVPSYSGVPSATSETNLQKESCGGIPHSLRGKIWPRLTGAFVKQEKASSQSSPLSYAELVHCSQSIDPHIIRQIEKVRVVFIGLQLFVILFVSLRMTHFSVMYYYFQALHAVTYLNGNFQSLK